MGRIAAYLGPDISLKEFLIDPPHSLFYQAWESHELEYAQFNADGYGFGWFQDERPQRYIYPHPIWHDQNLPALAQSMHAPAWLGAIRGMRRRELTRLNPNKIQPFVGDQLLFMHEGFVEDFNLTLRPSCLQYIDPPLAAEITTNSDSEYLFGLLRQRLRETDELSVAQALGDILSTLEVTLRDIPALLNIVVYDGIRLIAARHATNHPCPTLYYCKDHPDYPGAQLIASEPLDRTGDWEQIPQHHIVTLSIDRPAHVVRL